MAPKRAAVLRRPAARALVLRRPARTSEAEGGEGQPDASRALHSLSLVELQQLGAIALGEARYYGRFVQVAGHVRGIHMDGGEIYLDLEVTGTKDDELLRVLSGTPGRKLSVHVCPDGCTGALTDALLVHGKELTKVDLSRLPWFTNLQGLESFRSSETKVAGGKIGKIRARIPRGDERRRGRETRGEMPSLPR